MTHITAAGASRAILGNIDGLKREALYMSTSNKAQLMAAIKAVSNEAGCVTVIDAISENGNRLARYTFPSHRNRDVNEHRTHLNKIAATVRRTPAAIWR